MEKSANSWEKLILEIRVDISGHYFLSRIHFRKKYCIPTRII